MQNAIHPQHSQRSLSIFKQQVNSSLRGWVNFFTQYPTQSVPKIARYFVRFYSSLLLIKIARNRLNTLFHSLFISLAIDIISFPSVLLLLQQSFLLSFLYLRLFRNVQSLSQLLLCLLLWQLLQRI